MGRAGSSSARPCLLYDGLGLNGRKSSPTQLEVDLSEKKKKKTQENNRKVRPSPLKVWLGLGMSRPDPARTMNTTN